MTITRRLALFGPATVAVGAAAFSSTPARAAMKTESIDYSHGNTKLKAHVAYDDSVTGKRPAIFMVHARNGLTDFAKQQAEEWSKLGYYVFATDMLLLMLAGPRMALRPRLPNVPELGDPNAVGSNHVPPVSASF